MSISRRALMSAFAATTAVAGFAGKAAFAQASADPAVLEAMRRATRFMVEEAAVNGGYVWSYLPDFSRRWGELEASPTMIWIQPPGTATMGHLFLDAYHATGDEFYYEAARSATGAVIAAQVSAGGWNYVHDTAGEAAEQQWYDTVAANAWRLEEFRKRYGNGTFDDAGTSEAAQLLLRMYLEKRDETYRGPLYKAIDFILDAQYPNGGWPQRFPLPEDEDDYTRYITFNDDVAGENLEFLIFAYQALGEARLLDPIRRGMDIFLETQQPMPQPGWGLQHYVHDLTPAPARSIEPRAFATHTTAANIRALIGFYRLTGDRKYLARIPEAIDWLESVAAPADIRPPGRTHPTFIQIGNGRPLYIHRRGSNITNGSYYADENPNDTVIHYGSFRAVDTDALRAEYEAAAALSPEQASAGSPLLAASGSRELPRYFTLKDVDVSDLNTPGFDPNPPSAERVAELIGTLNERGYWSTPLTTTSNPYIGQSPAEVTPGEYRLTRVGDQWDTSPYVTDFPVEGVSTSVYIRNMGQFIQALGAR